HSTAARQLLDSHIHLSQTDFAPVPLLITMYPPVFSRLSYSFFLLFGSFLLSLLLCVLFFFFFSSRRRHTRLVSDWSSDVCSSDLGGPVGRGRPTPAHRTPGIVRMTACPSGTLHGKSPPLPIFLMSFQQYFFRM